MQVVLASRSPQRREILERLGVEFEVRVPEVKELTQGDAEVVVLENARRKAAAVTRPGAIVIGCDTEVLLDGAVLGKPGDEEKARAYLERLSGRTHDVLSGLVLIGPEDGDERTGVTRSQVTFHDLDQASIDRYLRAGEWRERAGGYAIQGLGAILVAGVRGDISNVIGLPVSLLLDLAPDLVALAHPGDG
jgi:septum formation protein